ncbi:DUF938 domain-containing protein [Ruegeria sp.]|uniref:DUF938 domain-containing protein n=1 Tax=Ruegeria sp. TaxID=1879320 RepID=UPI003C7E7847
MGKRKLPPNASVANKGDGAKLLAPAASRNAKAISDLAVRIAPRHGQALELASGTGQHITAFAQRLQGVFWQPTEIAAERRASIDAYAENLPNVAPALHLDATIPGWHKSFSDQHLIVLINLLHLIDAAQTKTLIAEATLALRPSGRLLLYGPFLRAGELTSEGDRRFHTALTEQDPTIGYKDDSFIRALLESCGLVLVETVEMPANNLAFVAEKPGT